MNHKILVIFQVAAHFFLAGANIVKLGIQKTRGPEDEDDNEELFLGSYWSSFRKVLSKSTDADYDKVNFQDKHGCDIQEYNKSDINDIY